MAINYLLNEATEKSTDAKEHVANIKKMMNTCQLTKFKSNGECSKFYSAFFLNSLPDIKEDLTFAQWSEIYMTLLNDESFNKNLCLYIAMWQPADYKGMFNPLMILVDSELAHIRDNRIRFLSNAKALLKFMNTSFDSIAETVKANTSDPDVIKFLVTINQVVTTDIFYIDKQIQNEMNNSVSPDDTVIVVRTPITEAGMLSMDEISEDAKELIEAFEHADRFYTQFGVTPDMMNESIVKKGREAAKQAAVATKKAEQAFEEFVTKKVIKLRNDRRNRKHAEMVGEALRISHEIKRLLGSIGIGFLTKGYWGVMAWIISVVIDRYTDRKDRAVLVADLKDEIEIVEEKISMAERNGDDKSKIELIRLRQKMTREYERINRMRFDKSRLMNT